MTADRSKRQTRRVGRAVLGASVPRDKADLIEQAADLIGETVSGFIGLAAIKRAEREIEKAARAARTQDAAA